MQLLGNGMPRKFEPMASSFAQENPKACIRLQKMIALQNHLQFDSGCFQGVMEVRVLYEDRMVPSLFLDLLYR